MKIISKQANPVILIVTPLFTGHTIYKECSRSLKRNDTPFDWISFEGKNEKPKNIQLAIDEYRHINKLPQYIQVLDRDIICGRHMLDRLYDTLKDTDSSIGFAYCPFEFKGHVNMKIPPLEYDINRLIKGNYISGNSLFKTDVLLNVDGFNAEQYLHRLNDWAIFLRLYREGYAGILCKNAYFTAISKENDISSGSNEEYVIFHKYVVDKYVKPLLI